MWELSKAPGGEYLAQGKIFIEMAEKNETFEKRFGYHKNVAKTVKEDLRWPKLFEEVEGKLDQTGQPLVEKQRPDENIIFQSGATQTGAAPRRGGIDFNPANLHIKVEKNGKGVIIPIPDEKILNMTIEGFVPTIINVTPITNLPLLLGIAQPQEKPSKSADANSKLELGKMDHRRMKNMLANVALLL